MLVRAGERVDADVLAWLKRQARLPEEDHQAAARSHGREAAAGVGREKLEEKSNPPGAKLASGAPAALRTLELSPVLEAPA
jgi:hypothetical protein